MIKLFHFHNPHNYYFAQAGRRGTWYPHPGPGLCRECRTSQQKRVPPLILEWEPGSDQIGDFVWPGIDDEIVITERVRHALEGRFRGFNFQPIAMWQDPKLKRSQRITKRTQSRVWLPYEGPPLWDLWVTARCHLDLRRSGVTFEKECSICGKKFYKGPPFEERHLVVDSTSWGGEDIFRIEQSGWIFCTERMKEFIESAGFTNVSFLEDGEILTDESSQPPSHLS